MFNFVHNKCIYGEQDRIYRDLFQSKYSIGHPLDMPKMRKIVLWTRHHRKAGYAHDRLAELYLYMLTGVKPARKIGQERRNLRLVSNIPMGYEVVLKGDDMNRVGRPLLQLLLSSRWDVDNTTHIRFAGVGQATKCLIGTSLVSANVALDWTLPHPNEFMDISAREMMQSIAMNWRLHYDGGRIKNIDPLDELQMMAYTWHPTPGDELRKEVQRRRL